MDVDRGEGWCGGVGGSGRCGKGQCEVGGVFEGDCLTVFLVLFFLLYLFNYFFLLLCLCGLFLYNGGFYGGIFAWR